MFGNGEIILGEGDSRRRPLTWGWEEGPALALRELKLPYCIAIGVDNVLHSEYNLHMASLHYTVEPKY
jgi:hypothetical protein